MTTLTVPSIALEPDSPADRLRRTAAAVRVHFTWWGVHKTLTAQQKEEVGATCGADTRFLTAGKRLVDVRHEAFRRLTSLRSSTVKFWKGISLPYVEPGLRLIRQSDIELFVHKLEDFRAELAEAEADLNGVYDDIKADARQRLGRLYNPADYPPEVRGLFGVAWDFPSVEPPSYLMRLSPDLYEQEQRRVAARFEEAVRLAEQAFLEEFARLVAHLTERLSTSVDGERKVFRDSAVGNLTEFFERFRRLGVHSSAELDRLVQEAQRAVRGVDAQALRTSDDLRAQVASQLSGVQATLDGMLIDRPRRRIVRATSLSNGNGHATRD